MALQTVTLAAILDPQLNRKPCNSIRNSINKEVVIVHGIKMKHDTLRTSLFMFSSKVYITYSHPTSLIIVITDWNEIQVIQNHSLHLVTPLSDFPAETHPPILQ